MKASSGRRKTQVAIRPCERALHLRCCAVAPSNRELKSALTLRTLGVEFGGLCTSSCASAAPLTANKAKPAAIALRPAARSIEGFPLYPEVSFGSDARGNGKAGREAARIRHTISRTQACLPDAYLKLLNSVKLLR
jgi:hypothetical protein